MIVRISYFGLALLSLMALMVILLKMLGPGEVESLTPTTKVEEGSGDPGLVTLSTDPDIVTEVLKRFDKKDKDILLDNPHLLTKAVKETPSLSLTSMTGFEKSGDPDSLRKVQINELSMSLGKVLAESGLAGVAIRDFRVDLAALDFSFDATGVIATALDKLPPVERAMLEISPEILDSSLRKAKPEMEDSALKTPSADPEFIQAVREVRVEALLFALRDALDGPDMQPVRTIVESPREREGVDIDALINQEL